jgi:uncharacterized protein YukE
MSMIGADAAELEGVASRMRRAADELDAHSRELSRQLGGLGWLGRLAGGFLAAWNGQHQPHIGSTAAFIREAADRLALNANQQREASGAPNSGQSVVDPSLFCEAPKFGSIVPRSVAKFDSKGSARADMVEAFWATGDSRRAEGDEIEIRKLDNGNYVVVLPGVVDLTNKLGAVIDASKTGHAVDPWYVGDQPNTARRMEYAISESQDTSDSFINPYATRVMEQMKAAGIPEGANVMFVGHSFGAYTAMELAGNDKFNSADGVSEGYHVNVTHVVAAGADTNWKLPELPNQTNALIWNNYKDAAFRAEDVLVDDVAPSRPGQVQIEFFGKSDWGATKGAGHAPEIYAKWLSESTNRPELNAWLDDAGTKYSGPGTALSAKVPDIR